MASTFINLSENIYFTLYVQFNESSAKTSCDTLNNCNPGFISIFRHWLTYALLRVLWIDFEEFVTAALVSANKVLALVHAVTGWRALVDVYKERSYVRHLHKPLIICKNLMHEVSPRFSWLWCDSYYDYYLLAASCHDNYNFYCHCCNWHYQSLPLPLLLSLVQWVW